jgi:hypothetical protein
MFRLRKLNDEFSRHAVFQKRFIRLAHLECGDNEGQSLSHAPSQFSNFLGPLLDDNTSPRKPIRMRHPLRQRSAIAVPAAGARRGPRRHRTK